MSLVKIDDIKHLISVVFVAVKEVQITYKHTLILMNKKSSYLAKMESNMHNV